MLSASRKDRARWNSQKAEGKKRIKHEAMIPHTPTSALSYSQRTLVI